MESQERFLELMDEIRQIAATQHNYITKEDIGSYLGDTDISGTQLEAVYNYLASLGVVVEGHHYVSGEAPSVNGSGIRRGADTPKSRKKPVASNTSKNGKTEIDRAERNRRLYRRDLKNIEKAEGSELTKLVADFLNGDNRAREHFIENRLRLVVKLAEKYNGMDMVADGTVPIEEVISEGNLGLLIGIEAISSDAGSFFGKDGKPDLDGVDEVLRIEIIHAMETYIDSHMSGRDMENAILARINLLHEAAKYMTEEMGRVPFKEELSEYTKIPVNEIVQIMGLSEDAKRLSDA